MTTLSQITGLITEFGKISASRKRSPVDFKAEFTRLGIALKPLQAQAAERFRRTAPEFNVFRILRLADKEVITHSPFIANLFYPSGTHGQRSLFLQAFLNYLSKKNLSSIFTDVVADDTWQMRTESVTEFGNLDIVLWSPHWSARIVIENKIGASDQPAQLGRYWNWMKAHSVRAQQLFYLTPTGHSSDEADKARVPYVRLSYKSDIRHVIKTSLEEVVAPRLKETLAQYLELIDAF
ncbi:MAG TPA: PD-(D/E)XK nuclease family protein [Candidatus Udaeobacter sp.]|jgi:hypothetical protein